MQTVRYSITILKEAVRTLKYLTENNLLQYADLEKKVEAIHSSYVRTGSELKRVEAHLCEVQPLIKNISNYQRLKPVYDAYMKAADKPTFRVLSPSVTYMVSPVSFSQPCTPANPHEIWAF